MMDFGMSGEHTSYQMRSVRDQVAQCRGRSADREITGREANQRSQPVSWGSGGSDPRVNAAGIGEDGRRPPNSIGRPGYLPRLRSRVGFTLVEAGLRLLPEGSQQHG